ncbi:MAG: hypothetical protein JWR72_3986 [Flavisolibacter sp.]|nr:hypothetical protein [Flavisolibacter sp.]
MKRFRTSYVICIATTIAFSCKSKTGQTLVQSFPDLQRGEVVSCGPADGEMFGAVSFSASVPPKLQTYFNTAIALLHSFEYDEAEKMFAKVIDGAPSCAMAYWGVAMCNFHSLWAPPTEKELQKGIKAIEIARSISTKTKREADYIEAIAAFYEHADRLDHRSRLQKFEKAMEGLYLTYPDDIEAAVFYALALNAAADPSDKTFSNQKKAINLLNPVFQRQPLHPGIAHYILHNCDYPELAELALPAARKYAAIAPSSAHAQHMPSHIFTRLGLWGESIKSNLVAASSAKCYGEKAKIKGHWDEELHAMDYLMYSYLQKGDDDRAKGQLDYLGTINEVSPLNFKTAYAFASIPARYAVERKQWKEAANLPFHPVNYPWEKFSWQKAIIHFTRCLGAVHTGDMQGAKMELENLNSLYTKLTKEKEKAKEAAQVAVQIKTAEAWIEFKQGHNEKALELMTAAAGMEDAVEKHPVTPGEVIPARELLAEMLLEIGRSAAALEAFEQNLKSHPGRLNALYGAGVAANKLGDKQKATSYFKKLMENVSTNNSGRTEVQKVKQFLDGATAAL